MKENDDTGVGRTFRFEVLRGKGGKDRDSLYLIKHLSFINIYLPNVISRPFRFVFFFLFFSIICVNCTSFKISPVNTSISYQKDVYQIFRRSFTFFSGIRVFLVLYLL